MREGTLAHSGLKEGGGLWGRGGAGIQVMLSQVIDSNLQIWALGGTFMPAMELAVLN